MLKLLKKEKMRRMKNLNKSEKPKCKLLGEDGNIYNLMGIASRTLKKNGLEEEAKEMFNKITTEAKSYDEALCIIMDYVDVTGEEISEDEEY